MGLTLSELRLIEKIIHESIMQNPEVSIMDYKEASVVIEREIRLKTIDPRSGKKYEKTNRS